MIEALKKHSVIPDVIGPSEPKHLLKVSYGGTELSPGDTLTPTFVQNSPSLSWPSNQDTLYTMMIIDPDAPSRSNPKNAPWLHWLVVNIKGSDISTGNTVAFYVGSAPPEGSGLHRYIYLVYEQSKLIEGLDPLKIDQRPRWNYKGFLDAHQLKQLVACNLHLSEYDDYVPIAYEKLRS
ncbi:phosphatidylethanolamine-binding protein homolog F40A3.3-like [Schistocerca gregaria]|uniref:phosphatidylethanolamine-binding protein homolog F40A3.3-like n=1 Tax=Schistocerca gregaria TaxID=7010 RepID=UPI00211E93FF|nr:phosphatidylethanolamine-binding protein homolog F40A3.3-like [Schistocerca gregaria]